ncbi:SDR family oxidoreductase [Kribbella pittospori]|uniref:SDR family oxidoreductase n=1 Tax=Kribbella pittospori TaxID=722689 RepID=UPI0013F3B7EF|nr:SDR family oxidoreductase [Kribbella pittospori]
MIERYGRLDALVNNAAVGRVGRLTDLDAEGVCEVMTTNFVAVADLTRLALPHVRRTQGDIVMVASALAWFPAPPLSLYSATRASVHGLVAALRRQETRDVRVHEILPGFVATEWLAYASGWRPTDARPHAATAIGTAPSRVAAMVERC